MTEYTKVQETAPTGGSVASPADVDVLRLFEVYVEGDEGIRIEHMRKCSWDERISGCSLVDLIEQAKAHAAECDAKPYQAKAPE